MQPIPVPVTNVTVWPSIDWPGHAGIGPVVPPVIENAHGTYAVGTLAMDIFYNLNLDAVQPRYPLKAGAKYHASVTTADGKTLETPWMYCLNAGSNPKFGRTSHALDSAAGTATGTASPADADSTRVCQATDLIQLGALEDVTVAQQFQPPAIGTIVLVSGATGELVATRTGTPHLMGFTVNGGERLSHVRVGASRISISGKRVDNGDLVSYSSLTCRSNGDPALFLQTFPG